MTVCVCRNSRLILLSGTLAPRQAISERVFWTLFCPRELILFHDIVKILVVSI